MKYQIPDEAENIASDPSDMIVYCGDDEDGEKGENDMIKVEIINDTEQFEGSSDWLEEEETPLPPPKKLKRMTMIEQAPKISRQSTVLDSADDQRIRETACMSCEVCGEPLDSLRDAKAHFKVKIHVKF